MPKGSCIFCRVASGATPSYKVYEDKKYVAFLDLYPNVAGQVLLVPKKHMNSLFSSLSPRELTDFMLAVRKVANIMRRRLGVSRVHLVLEGTGVKHLHAKLYPASGYDGGKFKAAVAAESVFFKKYPGYVTSQLGPRASAASLKRIQERLAGN